MYKKQKVKIILILLSPLIIIVNMITKKYPMIIEKYYSTGIDRWIRQFLSLLTSPFQFSFAEMLVFILLIGLIASFIMLIIKIKTGGFFEHLLSILVYLSLLYFFFMICWGFNYNRLSFDKIAGLKVESSSRQELIGLCGELIQRANYLRNAVKENKDGVMTIPEGYKSVLSRAVKGYEKAAVIYPALAGKYGPPKPILLSEKMCYTGITGIYMPYTGEPNVNVSIEEFMLPCTASHEMAHQRGFAREDEANYIAYVVCELHPDQDFQYSGVMLALINSMNALSAVDEKAYTALAAKYSEGVRRDLQYQWKFWEKYSGKIEKVSDQVNNSYLKSNGQEEGVESYGRMVDLLLAEYRKNKAKGTF